MSHFVINSVAIQSKLMKLGPNPISNRTNSTMYVKNPSLVAAQRVVVARPVVALAALVGLLASVLPHVHLHHSLPRRLQGHDSMETKLARDIAMA